MPKESIVFMLSKFVCAVAFLFLWFPGHSKAWSVHSHFSNYDGLLAPPSHHHARHGPLDRYVKLRFVHAPGIPGTFSPPPWVSDPDMHHGTCATHVP